MRCTVVYFAPTGEANETATSHRERPSSALRWGSVYACGAASTPSQACMATAARGTASREALRSPTDYTVSPPLQGRIKVGRGLNTLAGAFTPVRSASYVTGAATPAGARCPLRCAASGVVLGAAPGRRDGFVRGRLGVRSLGARCTGIARSALTRGRMGKAHVGASRPGRGSRSCGCLGSDEARGRGSVEGSPARCSLSRERVHDKVEAARA